MKRIWKKVWEKKLGNKKKEFSKKVIVFCKKK